MSTRRWQNTAAAASVAYRFAREHPLAAVCLVAATVAAVSAVLPRRYEAEASFMLTTTGSKIRVPAYLQGLASQLGADLGGEGESPAFYRDFFQTRRVLMAAFPEISPLPARKQEQLLKRIRRTITVSPDAVSGVTRIALRAGSTDSAVLRLTRLLQVVDSIDGVRQRWIAGQRLRFLSERVQEQRRALDGAEADLAAFRRSNRIVSGSPLLELESSRLLRHVNLEQEMYLRLFAQREEALNQAANDVPQLVLVELPYSKARPVSPRIILNVVLSVLVAALAMASVRLWPRIVL